MVHINGNEITLALGIIAAVLILLSIIALLIKECRYHRKHRDEEKMLNADTSTSPIDLPSRGFSLLRRYSRAARHRASSAEEFNASKTPSRASSLLRSLSRMTRFGSKRPRRDLESQNTAYRSPSTAVNGTEVHKPEVLYESRGQQWVRVQPGTPRIVVEEPPSREGYPYSPDDIVSPVGPDLQISEDIGGEPVEPWRRAMPPPPRNPARLQQPFGVPSIERR